MAAVARKRARQGLRTPEWDERPQLRSEAAWIWMGFQVLCQTRTSGFGPNPIALAAMTVYLDLTGTTDALARQLFVECVLALDAVSFEWMSKHADDA